MNLYRERLGALLLLLSSSCIVLPCLVCGGHTVAVCGGNCGTWYRNSTSFRLLFFLLPLLLLLLLLHCCLICLNLDRAKSPWVYHVMWPSQMDVYFMLDMNFLWMIFKVLDVATEFNCSRTLRCVQRVRACFSERQRKVMHNSKQKIKKPTGLIFS